MHKKRNRKHLDDSEDDTTDSDEVNYFQNDNNEKEKNFYSRLI
jgi:hypothetical protein